MKKTINILTITFALITIFAFNLAPQAAITGQVTSDGKPLPGVDVSVKKSNQGTVSDMKGNYSLDVGGDADTLVFSNLGYQTQRVAIKGRKAINVQMKEE